MICNLKIIDFIGFVSVLLTAFIIILCAIVFGDALSITINAETVTAFTGITALFVSAFLSFLTFKYQTNLALIQSRAAIKQKWLHEFKDDIASFIAYSSMINDFVNNKIFYQNKAHKTGDDFSDEISVIDEKLQEYKEKMALHVQRIRFFLEEKKPRHSLLIGNIKEWNDVAREWEDSVISDPDDAAKKDEILSRGVNLRKTIIKQAQDILCDELLNI